MEKQIQYVIVDDHSLIRDGIKNKLSELPMLQLVGEYDETRGLLNGAFAPGRDLGSTAFEALTQVIGSVRTCSLTYSSLEDALELIRGARR